MKFASCWHVKSSTQSAGTTPSTRCSATEWMVSWKQEPVACCEERSSGSLAKHPRTVSATNPDSPKSTPNSYEAEFKYDGLGAATLAYGSPSGLGHSGTGVLKVDGKVVSTQKMAKTIPMTLQWDENFDVGADTGTPVDDRDYKVPFRFNGSLDKLTLTIDRPKLAPEDIEKLKMAMDHNPAQE